MAFFSCANNPTEADVVHVGQNYWTTVLNSRCMFVLKFMYILC